MNQFCLPIGRVGWFSQ